jgi:tetraacyldisaccharide 4'-kinase
VPVVVSADRAAGVSRARAAGATVAVLDDAFQHRGLARRADVVLVSADRWSSTQRLLPAGPWREPVRAIRRATLVVVTRKAASLADADRVDAELARIAPDVPRATLQLAPASLVDASRSGELALDRVAGRPIRVLAGIADPSALLRQLEALGGRVTADVYPDHHDFSEAEIERFSQSIPADGLAICTLKDAVKVGVRWPRAAPTLWYVSQHVRVERGADGVERMLDDLARAHDRT